MDVQISDKLTEKIKNVLERYRIRLAILFGSRATGKANLYSDIDIAILPSNNIEIELLICDLAEELDIREDFIDVINLQDDLPYELLFRIFTDGILIMGDEKLYEDLKHRVILKYLDFKEFIRIHRFVEKYIESLKGARNGRTFREVRLD